MGVKMKERRSSANRREIKDRRNGGTSLYNFSERRSLRFRRSDTDRRKKKEIMGDGQTVHWLGVA